MNYHCEVYNCFHVEHNVYDIVMSNNYVITTLPRRERCFDVSEVGNWAI